MLPVKAVREAVITTLIEWHDKFVSVLYVNDESSVTTFHITPLYIPNGFSPVETPDKTVVSITLSLVIRIITGLIY